MKAKTINQNTTYDGWEELGNAVVVQAADDYRAAVMRLRMFPRDEVARRMMKDVEEFFHSPRFSMFWVICAVSASRRCFISGINDCNFSKLPFQQKCSCPIFKVLTTSAWNPPRSPQNLAAADAAATTELSSITIGTT